MVTASLHKLENPTLCDSCHNQVPRARMHEWLRCASGVGVTALNCRGLLQSLMIIVIADH